MKAFEEWEKWWDKNHQNYFIDDELHGLESVSAFDAWKAALEWVKGMMETNICLGESAIEPMYNVKEEIERELAEDQCEKSD